MRYRMKVLVLGNPDEVKIRVDQYKFAIKSVNLSGFQSLIDNLIDFKARENPYVDSILSIKNTKSRFKVLKKCDPVLVEAVRLATCIQFRLNRDQECVLNEVTKWFLERESLEDVQDHFDEITGVLSQVTHPELAPPESNVILVHGAFGCGKSYLLVAIIRFICTLLDHLGDTKIKILVCALTNIAVDRILLMLKNSQFEDFARVGSLRKINKQLLRYTHHSGGKSGGKKQADREAVKELENMINEIKMGTLGDKRD